MGRKYYTDEFLLNELRRFYNENGIAPGRRDFKKYNGYPSNYMYIERFGSWNNGLLAAGLSLTRTFDYDTEFLKQEIYRFIDENGRIPGRRDMNLKNGYPSYIHYTHTFGSWNKCLAALNLRILEYTEDILIADLKRFYVENNRIPLKSEMCTNNGYIPFKQYLKLFNNWENALYKAGLTIYDYSDDALLNILKKFYNTHARSPSITDLNNDKNNPPVSVYYRKFISWNNALKLAGLPINQIHESLNGDESCIICGNMECNTWSIVNGNRICNRCISGERKYLHGKLNPNSKIGFGLIMEHVVFNVLNDCIKCNTPEHFNYEYDLISKKYGTINVKSSHLICRDNTNNWIFTVGKATKIPDNFILIGLDETNSFIDRVWIIPGKNNMKNKSGFCLTNSEIGLSKLKKYEVDSKLYNEIYQNLDIYSLPEFCNFNKPEEGETA